MTTTTSTAMSSTMTRKTLTILVGILFVVAVPNDGTNTLVHAQTDNENNICRYDFAPGQTFQPGQSLGAFFETRCGPWIDYPCYCNPSLENQIECPYCGYATSTPDLLRCAGDNQEITFIDQFNNGQRCICDASDPTNPVESCQDDPSAEVCTMETINGGTRTFQPGDIIEGNDLQIMEQNRCGQQQPPCRCNPNFPNGLECPYCSFATDSITSTTRQSSSSNLLCLEEGETAQFVDLRGQRLECECVLGKTPSFPPDPVCVEIGQSNGNDCSYVIPSTGQTVTLGHLEIDLNVPTDDGTDVFDRCQCFDGDLECTGGQPNPNPTPRPNPMPTPTNPVEEPTLAPVTAPSGAVTTAVRTTTALLYTLVVFGLL